MIRGGWVVGAARGRGLRRRSAGDDKNCSALHVLPVCLCYQISTSTSTRITNLLRLLLYSGYSVDRKDRLFDSDGQILDQCNTI